MSFVEPKCMFGSKFYKLGSGVGRYLQGIYRHFLKLLFWVEWPRKFIFLTKTLHRFFHDHYTFPLKHMTKKKQTTVGCKDFHNFKPWAAPPPPLRSRNTINIERNYRWSHSYKSLPLWKPIIQSSRYELLMNRMFSPVLPPTRSEVEPIDGINLFFMRFALF